MSVPGLMAAARPAGRLTANAVARPATRTADPGERCSMETFTRRLSPSLVVLVVTLFAAGTATGWVAYLHRSAVRQAHVPGTAAWPQHAVVAAIAGLAFGIAWWRTRRAGRRLWLLAPLGRSAARRVAALGRGALSGPAGFGRTVIAVPLGLLFLYGFFRSGMQVIGGLDPNATVNAWGGPGYAGAMACHYLDAVVIMAAAAWLLDHVLPAASAHADRRPGGFRPAGARARSDQASHGW